MKRDQRAFIVVFCKLLPLKIWVTLNNWEDVGLGIIIIGTRNDALEVHLVTQKIMFYVVMLILTALV
jgi:hypothetical protein